jgi:hypothetical protein
MLPSDYRKLRDLADKSGNRNLKKHVEEAERNSRFADELLKVWEEIEERRSRRNAR